MDAQIPAEGILSQRDYGDVKTYKIACDCQCDDCSHSIWVESDDLGVCVTTYTTQKTNFWSKTRWHHMWTLLTKGYVEYEASIMMSEQQALNYAETLKKAMQDVKEFRKNRK